MTRPNCLYFYLQDTQSWKYVCFSVMIKPRFKLWSWARTVPLRKQHLRLKCQHSNNTASSGGDLCKLIDEENCNVNANKCHAVAPSQGTSCQDQSHLLGENRLNGGNVTELKPTAALFLRGSGVLRCSPSLFPVLHHASGGAGAIQISLAGFTPNVAGVDLALK